MESLKSINRSNNLHMFVFVAGGATSNNFRVTQHGIMTSRYLTKASFNVFIIIHHHSCLELHQKSTSRMFWKVLKRRQVLRGPCVCKMHWAHACASECNAIIEQTAHQKPLLPLRSSPASCATSSPALRQGSSVPFLL